MSTLARNTRIWDHGKANSFIPMSSQILNPIIEVLEISVIITGSVIILYPRTHYPISEPDDNKKSRAIPQPPFTTMKFAASIGICSFTASLVLLFVICQFQGKLWKLDTPIERAISRDQGHLHRQLKADVAHQELLAELYYQHQLRERNDLHFNSYRDIGANYPCIYGENPVGLDTHASVNDGHKYACGLLHIKSKPIIYSFGSNRQQDFEKSILSYRPDSLIYVFDIKASNLPPVTDRDPKITYTTLGLGPRVNITDEMYLVHEIMKSYNHTHVDLLKIDIEGSEYDWLKHEPADTFARIGQLLIEVHDIRFGKFA